MGYSFFFFLVEGNGVLFWWIKKGIKGKEVKQFNIFWTPITWFCWLVSVKNYLWVVRDVLGFLRSVIWFRTKLDGPIINPADRFQ